MRGEGKMRGEEERERGRGVERIREKEEHH